MSKSNDHLTYNESCVTDRFVEVMDKMNSLLLGRMFKVTQWLRKLIKDPMVGRKTLGLAFSQSEETC